MATEIKPTSKNSPKIKVGNHKNILPAEKYAMPHDMSGNPVVGGLPPLSDQDGTSWSNSMKVSVGNVTKGPDPVIKTDGVKQRGYGAATKGFTARGPMA
jgi:hypothetical protein